MKRENFFCRILSAIVILFGTSTYSFAAGACDSTKYNCVDLSMYDNSHPVETSIKRSTPRVSQNEKERGKNDPEIPNTGIIPSDIHGDYFGYISYGGTGTNGVPFSKDFAAHNENGYGKWYGENGKKQFINFNDNDPENLSDNTKSIKERLGGSGTWVFGDLVTAGGPIINPMPGDTFGEAIKVGSWNGGYINDGKVGTFNGSVDKIRLPKGVTKDDIVFARVYWFGHLYKYNNSGMGDSLREICSAEEKQKAGGLACKRFSPTLNIPDIKNYQNVKLKIGDTSYDIEREICEGEFAYNSAKGKTRGTNQKYNMKYVCSTDITDKVREKFKDFSETIDIGVGDIKATKEAATDSNIVWTRGAASADKNIDSGYDSSNKEDPRLLPFGGWYVVLVYDKSMRSQAELMGLDFPSDAPDNDKYYLAREKAKIQGNPKEYIENTFKAKNITLFDGYMPLEPTASRPDITAEAQRDIRGFFTPKYGDVQGKLIFASFGANKGNIKGADINTTDGVFVAESNTTINSNRLPNNTYNPENRSFFNGSKSWLKVNDKGNYTLEGESGYHQGFDLDEFDISKKLTNRQSELTLAIKSSPYKDSGGQWVSNRAFVPFIGVSIDIYIPKLCYEQNMYDTQGWLGFYNEDGTPKDNPGNVEKLHVVTGENLYYRTEIRNKDIENNEDAEGVWVQLNTGNSNTYVPNSSGIDNVPKPAKPDDLQGLQEARYVFLQDNTAGAYSTQAKRAEGGSPDVTDEVYNNKQLNTVRDRQPRFYLGEGAGVLTAGDPVGGELKKGKSVYLEFNATIGRTFTYTPIKYTVGYSMKLAGSEEAIQGPTSIMERCVEADENVRISLLNGLKIVNQNFKDHGESDTDKNKTLAQDDRLFTQVAELPFDVNMIFKPDINDVFKDYCVEKDGDGKCSNYCVTKIVDNKKVCMASEDRGYIDLCENYAGVFKRADGKCRAQKYKKLPDGSWGIDYGKEGELDGSLQYFPLEGNLYLSAIRSGSGCKYVEDKMKLPFKVNGTRFMTNYPTDFRKKQNPDANGPKVIPIEKMEFEDAFGGVTFMFSYYPRGLSSPDTNTTMFFADLNSTTFDSNTFVDENGTIIGDMSDYYIYLQTQILYEKYIKGYKRTLSDERKKELIDEWYAATDEKTLEDRRNFQAELDNIVIEIRNAKTFFGVEMSPDGSFHVCDSDSFVIRPAYFRADIDKADKFAKLVSPNNTDANADITEANKTVHDTNYRVGGDYGENTDVLSRMFYAVSNKNHPVPNYHPVIGGDLATKRFKVKSSYNTNSLPAVDENVTTAYSEMKTYLKPFISDACYSGIDNHSFYIERDLEKQENLKMTLGTCANAATAYNGFKFENGVYVPDNTIGSYLDKEDENKRDLLGKYLDSCKIEGDVKVFDEKYWKVWDKTAISLWADFGLSSIDVMGDGYAKLNRFSQNQLIAQGLLEPNQKEKVAAALYTATLFEDKVSKKVKGRIFNYYNVGDVMVSLYDNSWTDAHGDQTFDERKDSNGTYWGSTCVLNSTSNKHNEEGKVGCDVGMENDQYVVLRYQPETIEVAIAGIDNSATITDANVTIYDNLRNGVSYTYFNQPDVFKPIVDGVANQALLNQCQLRNLALLNVSANAYISDKLYPNIVATLYDGKTTQVGGNNVARCGFASDLLLNIGFNYDCDTDPSDTRCAATATGVQKRTTNFTYRPFAHTDNDTTANFGINLNGTGFFIYDKNNDECLKVENNIAKGYDSRCFRVNRRGSGTEMASGPVNTDYQVSVPLKYAINLYSDISQNSGLLNEQDPVSGFYNPKTDPFRMLSTAFNQGRTTHHTESGLRSDASRIYVNFDRMQKSPQLPVLIYVSDFAFTRAPSDNNKTITPASFNYNSTLLGNVNEETYSESPTINTFDNFEEYRNKVALEYNATVAASIGTSAYFVYGKANEVGDGRTLFRGSVGTTLNIPILSMLYCGRTDNCLLLPPADRANPAIIHPYAPANVIFSRLLGAAPTGGFFLNSLDNYTGGDLTSEFVSAYRPELRAGLTQTREGRTTGGIEQTTYTADRAINTRVRVLTNPWLIYTPAGSNQRVFVDSTSGYGCGTAQYYNYFDIRFATAGTWGGHGKRKSDDDIVGNYVIMEEDLSATTSTKKTKDSESEISNNRMDW